MYNELYANSTCVFQENVELTSMLKLAEAEIEDLKLANDRLEYWVLTLRKKLESANDEISRLGMMLEHQAEEIQSEGYAVHQNDWSDLAVHHH